MATSARMSFNWNNNPKFTNGPQNMQKDMEVTQDMHLKMSKKIAQLTKVIYALNTKNDEHEAMVSSLRAQHEEAMQKLLEETSQKLSTYQQKIGASGDVKHKIEELQKTVAQHEHNREQAMVQFAAFKRQAEERETFLKTEHAQHMLAMSKEVLETKRHFEKKLEEFDSLKAQFDADKLTAMEALKQEHTREMDKLMHSYQDQQGSLESQQEELVLQLQGEVNLLHEKCEQLVTDNKQNAEDFEHKLSKAQAFYEKELAAIKQSHDSSYASQIEELENQNDKLKKDMAFMEAQYKKRVDDLVGQLSFNEVELTKYKSELEKLESSLKEKDGDSSHLSKQLSSARNEVSEMLAKLRGVELELSASKEMCAQQAQEMLKKSTQIGQLDATRLQHESTIRDLQSQLAKVKDKLNWMEQERQALEDKSQSTVQESTQQRRALEKALEDLSIEKQTLVERYERDIKSLEEKSSQKQRQMENDFQTQLNQLKSDNRDVTEGMHRDYERRLKTLKEDLEAQLEAERQRLLSEKAAIIADHEKTRADLSSKLKSSEEEVSRLQKIIADSEAGLGSVTSQVDDLKEASRRLQTELDRTSGQLREARQHSDNLQAELDKLKELHQAKLAAAAEELNSRLNQLTKDMDAKWTETLRNETMKLRFELTEQKEEDKRAALAQLAQMKDEEIAAARKGWESKVSDLLQQISHLKQNIDNKESQAHDELERLKREATEESTRLRQEMLEAAEEYSRKVDMMDRMQQDKIRQLEEQKEQTVRDTEDSLRMKHLEEMQAQVTAHRAAMDSQREHGERQLSSELADQRQRHKKEIDSVKQELLQQLAADLEQQARAHSQQLAAARMELQRAIELGKQKENENQQRISELQEDIKHRENHIRNVEAETRKLQSGISDMSRELEAKGKEILRARSDANQALRAREDELTHLFNEQKEALITDYKHEMQTLLTDANRAQEILKDKISGLQIMLEEAEEKYRNRESRDEDIMMISRLQEAVQDREQAMKKLTDDKRYYQMELVNRETNFNKVFNADPKVGVLNPLIKKQKGEKGATRFFSSPSLNRLNPLPGSPIHDGKLNPIKPLPPPVKKFVQ